MPPALPFRAPTSSPVTAAPAGTPRRPEPPARPPSPPRRRGPLGAALALGLLAAPLSACSSSGPSAPVVAASSPASGIHGDRLPSPFVLTAADRSAVFRSSEGGTTTLARLQAGRLMLVYFGYTHCPDVCPTTMADLGQALRGLPTLVQAHTQVVFITADPARDTPAVMRSWLSNFDRDLMRGFVGLTAPVGRIDAVAESLGVPLSPPTKQANGSVSVDHGAQTLALVGGRAGVLWTSATSVEDYAHDIGLLVDRVGGA